MQTLSTKPQTEIRISVVMPSFNEEESIEAVILDIKKHSSTFITEILLVDSSKDKTAAIAKQMGAKVINQPPQGHGVALKTAIEAATGDFIITADCDNTYPMEKIPALIKLMQTNNLEVISCNRLTGTLQDEMRPKNKLGNQLAALMVRLLYGIKTRDVATGMFCLKKQIVPKLNLKPYPALPPEIIIKTKKNKLAYLEVDIPYRDRLGVSKLDFTYAAKEYMKVIFGLLFK